MWRCNECGGELKVVFYKPVAYTVFECDKNKELHEVKYNKVIYPKLVSCVYCMNTSDNINDIRYWEEEE